MSGYSSDTLSGALARQLLTTRLFGMLNLDQLTEMLKASPVCTARAGEIILSTDHAMEHHFLLLEGELEIQRAWSVPGEANHRTYVWKLKPYDGETDFGFLSASASHLQVQAMTDIRYLLIDADLVDQWAGWSQQFTGLIKENPALRRRIKLAMQTSIFSRLPVEHAEEALRRLEARDVQAGELVIRQGDAGDAYFIIEEGAAELVRIDPIEDEVQRTLLLGSGDAFGEEALLQGGYRNASVTMTTPGRLLVLAKKDFDELAKPAVDNDLSAEEAQRQIASGARALIDCRYSMEYEDSRIPGARLIPLDQIRFHASRLDPAAGYIVYCRTGRRSRVAAWLLRERNIDALSLAGGIKDWPYPIETGPVAG